MDRQPEYVVTKDGSFYWVRENDGSSYWQNRGLFFFKFMAVRRARELASGCRIVNGDKIVVWEKENG